MAPLYILDKLSAIVGSADIQAKLKFVFTESSSAEETFVELMAELCATLRVAITKNRRLIAEVESLGPRADTVKGLKNMKEMVSSDAAKLGGLEQLLAAAHVGVRVKSGYAADMEGSE